MPDQTNLAKAQLRQIDADPEHPKEIEPDTWCTVQFNPESLKVSFKNEVAKPPGPGDQRGPAALQYVGKSTTQLSLTLWFDVGSPQGSRRRVDDVRLLTKEVAFFIKASPPKGKKLASADPAGPLRLGLVHLRRRDGVARGDARALLTAGKAVARQPRGVVRRGRVDRVPVP